MDDSIEENVKIKSEFVSIVDIKKETLGMINVEDWNTPNCSSVDIVAPDAELQNDCLTTGNRDQVQPHCMSTSDLIKIKKEPDNLYPIKNELLHETCDLPSIKSEDEISTPLNKRPRKGVKSQTQLKYCKKVGVKKKKGVYPCPVCCKNFPSTEKRNRHFNSHFDVPLPRGRNKKMSSRLRQCAVTCHFCGKFFIRKMEFLFHSLSYRLNSYVQILNPVPKPIKSKYSLTGLKRDLKFWRPTFECEICFKRYTHKGNLTVHQRNHSSEKPFKCVICCKYFSRKDALSNHMRIHTGEKPFKCDICFKCFNNSGTLSGHMHTHSTHTGDKPFNCEICSQRFASKGSLRVHRRIHTSEKPFKCKICFKCFKQQGILSNHMRTHTGDKPFKCEICSQDFGRKYHLTEHLRIHTNEKPFKCETCFKCFRQKGRFTIHMRSHTGKQLFK